MIRSFILLVSMSALTAHASTLSYIPIFSNNDTTWSKPQVQRKLQDKIPSLIQKATERFLQMSGLVETGPSYEVCVDPGFTVTVDPMLDKIIKTMSNYDAFMESIKQFQDSGVSVGSTTALIPEANDAAGPSTSVVTIADGKSGDTRFPHGNLKPVITVGERSVCPSSYGEKIAGVPDGLGAYLPDDKILRLVVQSEQYGPLPSGSQNIADESYTYPVNGDKAKIAGSHIQFVDYLREDFSSFMTSGNPASSMVTGMGEMVEFMYNLKGEAVGPRNGSIETTVGAHYSNTDANGMYTVLKVPAEGDWLLMSLCSAHLEQKHQWGDGLGFEDDIFLTNEEWMWYAIDKPFVGLSAHALDIHTKSLYATGAFALGGFEKIVEINPTHKDYVVLAVSGYNGPYDNDKYMPGQVLIPTTVLDARNTEYGPRPQDGTNYTWTKDIVPFRIYVGIKGKLEDGSDAPDDDFLARNGLKYGQLYGFAIDMRNTTGPTAGVWRDAWHKTAQNGDMVPGKWIAQPWRWDGQVRDFQHDGAWDYQLPPPGTEQAATSELEGYFWWNAGGDNIKGCKTEHISPDPRAGNTAFIQGSTCGYFGHLYVNNVAETLANANGDFPSVFNGTYYVYQGETDVTNQIELGGAGMLPGGRNATRNWDKDGMAGNATGKVTFEDIDGLEVFQDGDTLYVMLQEDSGNELGERMFISSPLEHESDGNNLTYYFVALSGGKQNTRAMAGASVPAGVLCHDGQKYNANSHEFSGLFDLSGMLRKDENGNFIMSASDPGSAKRSNDAAVAINDKNILVALQASNYACGLIKAFQPGRGGQWLVYQPNIPST